MNRRKFVTTVPVLAAGLASASPLLAFGTYTDAQDLLAELPAHFAPHIAVASEQQAALLERLSTPATTPKFQQGKLTFTSCSGQQVALFRRNDQFRVQIGG